MIASVPSNSAASTRHSFIKAMRWVVALLAFASAGYCVLAVLQAGSIYTGERALWNGNLWGSLALSFVAIGIFALLGHFLRRFGFWGKRAFVSLSLALAAFALWPVLKHQLAVGRCLDSGGSYNYVASACSHTENTRALSAFHTHGFLLSLATLLVLLAAVAAFPRVTLATEAEHAA